jgi:hypothetical protein
MTILRDRGELRTLVASLARTANGNSGPLDGYDDAESLRVQLEVTASAGTTPTLNVLVEDSLDGVTWNTIGTFTQKITTAREVINVSAPFSDIVRVSWTIGGSAGQSFTFSVVAFIQ